MQNKILFIVFLSILTINTFSLQQENQFVYVPSQNANNNETSKLLPGSNLPGSKVPGLDAILAPNLENDELLNIYKEYIKSEITADITKVTDLKNSPLADLPLKLFELDIHSERVQMPYDPKLKIGDGFDVENNMPKASPFLLNSILEEGTISEEGQDGKVDFHISSSTQELASALSTDAEAWGSGWGCTARASFTYDNNFKLKTNEVMLAASHEIDLGKSLVDPSNFVFTKDAKKQLATNYPDFRKGYGTHFIAGYTKACKLNIQFLKTVKDTEKKEDIAASLEMTYNGVAYQAKGKASMAYSKEQTDFLKDVKISIQYAGANNNAFIEGTDLASLNKAILDFPEDCEGNIQTYILWPYESAQSYVETRNTVYLLLKYKELQEKQEQIKQLEQEYSNQKIKDQEKKLKLQEEYAKYKNDLLNEAKAQRERHEQILLAQQKYKSGLQILDDLYTKAILENHILRATLLDEVLDDEQEKIRDEDIWKLKSLELEMSYKYEDFRNELYETESKEDCEFDEIADIITRAKLDIENTFDSDIIDVTECPDKNCLKCQKYNPEICDQCDIPTFNVNEKCLAKCPDGYYSEYIKAAFQNICIKCNPLCKTCENSGSKCTSCPKNKLLFENECFDKCIQGTKKNADGTTCSRCDNLCKLYADNSCKCTLCPSSEVLKDGKCVSSCGLGYFKNTAKQCIKCSDNCKECSSYASRCTSCPSGQVLQGNECQAHCKQFYQKVGEKCQQCKQSVESCSKYKINTCTCEDCQSGSYLSDQTCIASNKIKIKSIPAAKGSLRGCDNYGVLVGTCGSAKDDSCPFPGFKDVNHNELCAPQISTSYSEQIISKDYGYWAICSNGAAVQICRSGEHSDCGDYYSVVKCNENIPINHQDCYYVNSKEPGKNIKCKDGYAIIGSCESGKNKDCGEDGVDRGKNIQFGIKCCSIYNPGTEYHWKY